MIITIGATIFSKDLVYVLQCYQEAIYTPTSIPVQSSAVTPIYCNLLHQTIRASDKQSEPNRAKQLPMQSHYIKI